MAAKLILFLFLSFIPLLSLSSSLSEEEEIRAQRLFEQVKCVVCQGQTIKDSNAEIAKIMRLYIREAIGMGFTDSEILANLEHRYGKHVILAPSFASSFTKPLWIIPLFLLAIMLICTKKRILS